MNHRPTQICKTRSITLAWGLGFKRKGILWVGIGIRIKSCLEKDTYMVFNSIYSIWLYEDMFEGFLLNYNEDVDRGCCEVSTVEENFARENGVARRKGCR
eukprot:snap_masked-scaffold_59-processed-gene-0.31-mRNA-1 protein AED:1.00 eAED:1.00 QI:0/0/0/0/1/1/3/0/99